MASDLERVVSAIRFLSLSGDRSPSEGRKLRSRLRKLRVLLLGHRPRTHFEDRLFEEELRILLIDALPSLSPREIALCLPRPSVLARLTQTLSPVTDLLDRLLSLLSTGDVPGFSAALDLVGVSLAEALVLDAPLLHHAVRFDNAEAAQVLLERGVSPGCRDRLGQTALHAAASGLSLRCVRLLVEWGADPGPPSAAGDTPLAVLARKAGLCRSAARDSRLLDLARALTPRGLNSGPGRLVALLRLAEVGAGPVAEWAIGELVSLPAEVRVGRLFESVALRLALSQRLSQMLRLLRLLDRREASAVLWNCVAMAIRRGLPDLSSALIRHLAGSLPVECTDVGTAAVAGALCQATMGGSSTFLQELLDVAGTVAGAACLRSVVVNEAEGSPLVSALSLSCLLDRAQLLRLMLVRQVC